ncbi:MAG TPA: hypothetical protein VF698_08135, partial [Thermoanaerobaculia bacterium]
MTLAHEHLLRHHETDSSRLVALPFDKRDAQAAVEITEHARKALIGDLAVRAELVDGAARIVGRRQER